jgi:hypothetical protein
VCGHLVVVLIYCFHFLACCDGVTMATLVCALYLL